MSYNLTYFIFSQRLSPATKRRGHDKNGLRVSVIESQVQPTGVQLKRKAKLSTVIGLEESKVANRDWVDHQAYSLLQYINVVANLFIMGNYFNELR